MSYPATVLSVMIASPMDVDEARDALEKSIHSWNDANSESKRVVRMPWRWETSSVPTMGDHPQAILNAQGLDRADIVFALFWGRLGSPTPSAVSGTVEEIERAIDQGKPVHLYFCTAPLPHDVDTAQLDGLRAFRKEIRDRGLLGEFKNVDQLLVEVWKCIESDLTNNYASATAVTPGASPVRFLVQPRSENEVTYSRGVPSSRRRSWIEVTNRSTTTDAENVRFSLAEGASMRLITPEQPITIHALQSRDLPTMHFLGGSETQPVLSIEWTEDGVEKTRDFHIA
jgi:hypothetical protein